jgi:hypothetical protein
VGWKKNLEANIDMNTGDKPNKMMLVTDAISMKSGKFWLATNKKEKYLDNDECQILRESEQQTRRQFQVLR